MPNLHRSVPGAVAAVLVLLLPACGIIRKTGELPVQAVTAVIPGMKSNAPDPATLQAQLQRFSDDYLFRTLAAIDDYRRKAGSPEADNKALEWKLTLSTSVISLMSGPNPTLNLVDLLCLATLTRTALEEEWARPSRDEAFEPWLRVSRSLEVDAWKIGDSVFKPEQQQELRNSIEQWWAGHPEARAVLFARPDEIAAGIRQKGEERSEAGSVFALVGLDPTAGLDPAVREVTRTRLFAERAMYTMQRMPFLLRWQVELLTGQVLQHPNLEGALTNTASLAESAARLSRASESVSQTAAQLPDRLSAERKAILDALETQQGRLRDLASEVNRTLTAGDSMSRSLNTTVATFDALMKRFGVGEPPSGPPKTNSPPFSILDYAHTADRLGLMAKELNILLKDAGSTLDSPALQKRLQDLQALSEHAKADARSILNHAFLLAAGLVLLTFACALAYRRLVPKPRPDWVGPTA